MNDQAPWARDDSFFIIILFFSKAELTSFFNQDGLLVRLTILPHTWTFVKVKCVVLGVFF
jgi:hypothetical protein